MYIYIYIYVYIYVYIYIYCAMVARVIGNHCLIFLLVLSNKQHYLSLARVGFLVMARNARGNGLETHAAGGGP